MVDVNLMWNSFNAGELSSSFDGRTDQDKYFAGCKLLENFVPLVQGPVTRRAGFRYVGETKDSGRAWFLPFEYSSEQSYLIEAGDEYLRFWVSRGQLLDGGSPYELVSPWTTADLETSDGHFALRAVQAGNEMWIAHQGGTVRPQKLTRNGAVSWVLDDVEFRYGPFEDVDPDSEITVTASDVTGSITLTADASLFRASDVGTTFYLELENPADVDPWEPDEGLGTTGTEVRYEGNFYELVDKNGHSNSGVTPPVHLYGDGKDGKYSFRYRHSGYGLVRITAFTDDMNVTGTVINDAQIGTQLPDQVAAGGTKRWARATFNDDDGWPTNVVFYKDRLFYVRGRKLCGSFVRHFDDFSRYDGPDITKETALTLDITHNRIDDLLWAVPARALLLGSARSEITVSEQTPQSTFAADNAQTEPQTEYGSRSLEPLRVGDAALFVQRAGRKLREMKYSFEIERYKADDLTVLADHILGEGVVDMDFQQEPDNLVWCALVDGTLAALTYNRERGVVAWTRHIVGGGAIVEAVGCLPSPDGKRDDLWIIARRTIDGNTVRYVEYLEDPDLVVADVRAGFFVDSGITYDGAATTTITGLDHLEGATVAVLADGSPHADCVVTGGEIELSRESEVVHVGFSFASKLQTMRLDTEAGGTSQGRPKSIPEVKLRVKNTIGGKAGPDFDTLDAIKGLAPSSMIGADPVLVNGDQELTMPADFGSDGYVCVQQDQPLPMTLVALVAKASIGDD